MNYKKLKELTGHSAGIYSLAFDGNFLYSGSADKFITRWDLTLGTQDKFAIKFDNPVYSICLINENKQLVVGLSTGDLHIFELVSRLEIKYFTQHVKAIFAIVENPFKKQFYTADADGNLAVWNSETLELLIYLPLDCGKIRRIKSSSNGENIAIVGQDGFVRIFETTFFNEVSCFKAHENGATAIMFNPKNESQIITGGKDALLKIWEWNSALLIQQIPAHNFVIYDIIPLEDGDSFASCSRDKSIKIWKLEDYSFQHKIDFKLGGHRHSVNCLIGIKNTLFCSGGDDKRIILWELDSPN
jgi:WD40 repeat protein